MLGIQLPAAGLEETLQMYLQCVLTNWHPVKVTLTETEGGSWLVLQGFKIFFNLIF